MWPFKFNLSQQTISENFSNNLLDTLKNGTVHSLYLPVGKILFRCYSSESKTKQEIRKLDPNYVTGYSDAESSFILSIYEKKSCTTGWQIQPVFAIQCHIKDIDLLKNIQSFFKVGVIVESHKTYSAKYTVNSIKDLINVIIPHFDKYPLITQKRADFLLFKSALFFMAKKEHITIKGLQYIMNIRASLNKGLTDILMNNFPNTIPVAKPSVALPKIIEPNWLLGFIEGESCFYIGITKNEKSKAKYYVSLLFKITQHTRDIELLRKIAEYFDCGTIQEDKTKKIVNLQCRKFSDIESIILPFLAKYSLQGSKSLDYRDFCKVVKFINNKSHLTSEGLDFIKQIKLGMNRGRDLNNKILLNSNSELPVSHYHVKGSDGFCKKPSVSCLMGTSKVKTLLNLNNPQVTKAYNSRVGTSEAIRLLNINTKISHNRKNKTWNEWLAGLIDGDGSFLLSKKGYASLEITMDIRDEHALQIIKNVYGGSIKLRSGANALRYRLHHKSGLLNLICDVNGHIRNSHRLIQLNKICYKYELSLIYPEKLLYDSAWLAGFLDAEGTVTINQSNTQLSISASQKTSEILQPLLELYNGNIYIDRGSSQSFKWYITKREDILKLVEYFKINPLRSAKKNRLHLIPKYYELKDLNAHKALPDTFLYKSWQYFNTKWLKYEDQNN